MTKGAVGSESPVLGTLTGTAVDWLDGVTMANLNAGLADLQLGGTPLAAVRCYISAERLQDRRSRPFWRAAVEASANPLLAGGSSGPDRSQ